MTTNIERTSVWTSLRLNEKAHQELGREAYERLTGLTPEPGPLKPGRQEDGSYVIYTHATLEQVKKIAAILDIPLH